MSFIKTLKFSKLNLKAFPILRSCLRLTVKLDDTFHALFINRIVSIKFFFVL